MQVDDIHLAVEYNGYAKPVVSRDCESCRWLGITSIVLVQFKIKQLCCETLRTFKAVDAHFLVTSTINRFGQVLLELYWFKLKSDTLIGHSLSLLILEKEMYFI